MTTNQAHRLAVAAAYREIADAIEADANFPVATYPNVLVPAGTYVDKTDDVVAVVRRAAQALGIDPYEDADTIAAERSFGPVKYRVYCLSEKRVAAHDALSSYYGQVTA